MMKQVVLCATAAIVAWGGFASSPLHERDFEKVNGRQVQDGGAGKKNVLYTDEVRSDHGARACGDSPLKNARLLGFCVKSVVSQRLTCVR